MDFSRPASGVIHKEEVLTLEIEEAGKCLRIGGERSIGEDKLALEEKKKVFSFLWALDK